jgi:hypothetical protein
VPRFVSLVLGLVALLVLVGIAGVVYFAWDRPEFYAGLVGALIGSVSAVSASALTQRYARERDAATYRRTVLTSRAERLRVHYRPLVRAASAFEVASLELQILWPSETEQQRNERVYGELRRVLEDIDDAVAGARLEPGTEPVLSAWRSSRGLFAGVQHIIESNARTPRTFTMQQLIDKVEELRQSVSNVAAIASAHLERLERQGYETPGEARQ